MLEQIPSLATQAVDCSSRLPCLSDIISEHLLPIVVRNLGAPDIQVRDTAHSTLFQLLEQAFITREQAEKLVCPTVVALSKVESLTDLNNGIITVSEVNTLYVHDAFVWIVPMRLKVYV